MSDDNVFHNPIDRCSYVAGGGWKTSLPENASLESPKERVSVKHVRLLTSEADIESRTSVEELAGFIKDLQFLTVIAMTGVPAQVRVLIQVKCTPTGHEIALAHQGEINTSLLAGLHASLSQAKPIRVSSEDVCFQIEFIVND